MKKNLLSSIFMLFTAVASARGQERRKLLKEILKVTGILAGVVAIVVIVAVIHVNARYSLDLFEVEGECLSENAFYVFQVTDTGDALAQELVQTDSIPKRTKLIVLFLVEEGQSYYKGQVIEVPPGKCARQIGVYKYISRSGDKEVPVVDIRDN